MGSDARAKPDGLIDFRRGRAGTGRIVGAKFGTPLASLASRVADLRGATRESEVLRADAREPDARTLAVAARRLGARSGGAFEVDARGVDAPDQGVCAAEEPGVQRAVDPPGCRRGTGGAVLGRRTTRGCALCHSGTRSAPGWERVMSPVSTSSLAAPEGPMPCSWVSVLLVAESRSPSSLSAAFLAPGRSAHHCLEHLPLRRRIDFSCRSTVFAESSPTGGAVRPIERRLCGTSPKPLGGKAQQAALAPHVHFRGKRLVHDVIVYVGRPGPGAR
jgi:hypothetical protein